MDGQNDNYEIEFEGERCQECGAPLPPEKIEARENGYFEFITECRECGAVYTD